MRLFFIVATLLFLSVSAAQAKYASIIIDAETGTVLHEQNADTQNYPASLTKMMTLYMLFDEIKAGKISLQDRMKVSPQASRSSPSKLYLEPGSTITVQNAILALAVKSANDVAVVVAEHLGGTERKFAVMMNGRAKEIGLRNTTFKNASGSPNSKQKSTARDLATLAMALYNNHQEFYQYFSVKEFTYKDKTYKYHNKMLKTYPGTDGIKTGYIRASGFNIATSVERDGKRMFGVVMGMNTWKERNEHMSNLFDGAFNGK